MQCKAKMQYLSAILALHSRIVCITLYVPLLGESNNTITQQTPGISQMLGWCWPTVYEAVPTSAQHWANASCFLASVLITISPEILTLCALCWPRNLSKLVWRYTLCAILSSVHSYLKNTLPYSWYKCFQKVKVSVVVLVTFPSTVNQGWFKESEG